MKNQECNEIETAGTRKRRLIPVVLFVLLAAATSLAVIHFYKRHDLNAFMKEHYGRWNPDKKHWEKRADEPHYVVCASKDIKIKGEPYHMLAVCGELPDENKSHAASGYVDIYVMKRTFSGLVPVTELTEIESGSFGTPGSVTVVRLGKDFYGFEEDSGWSGQGYTNGYTTIYVPVGNTFHAALRFSSSADNSGVCDEADEGCTPRTSIERSIEFVPTKDSNIYVARITSSGYAEGKPVSNVFTLYYIPKKHEYLVPKDFEADIGY